jgi:dimethylargininase
VTALDARTVLLNPQWVRAAEFAGYRILSVDADEPAAANVLRVGDAVVCGSSYGRTVEMLRGEGYQPHTVDTSELAKAEGALTCCAILVKADG